MKQILFSIILITALFSCKEEASNTDALNDEMNEQECVYKKYPYPKDSVFPFSQADKIEIIAYDSAFGSAFTGGRIHGYTIERLRDSMSIKSNIRDKVILNKNQADTLFSIFVDYTFENASTGIVSADCYNPRHAILFYKDGQLIEYVEICFECARIEFIGRKSKFAKFCYNNFCEGKWCYLSEYFKKCGMANNFSERNICSKNQFSEDI